MSVGGKKKKRGGFNAYPMLGRVWGPETEQSTSHSHCEAGWVPMWIPNEAGLC